MSILCKQSRDLDSLLDLGLVLSDVRPSKRQRQRATPSAPLDLIEHDDTYEAKLELAGFSKEDVEISIEANRIKIKATKKSEQQEVKQEYLINERASRSEITRSWPLPEHVEDVAASFADGLLSVVYAKHAPNTEKKKITIN